MDYCFLLNIITDSLFQLQLITFVVEHSAAINNHVMIPEIDLIVFSKTEYPEYSNRSVLELFPAFNLHCQEMKQRNELAQVSTLRI